MWFSADIVMSGAFLTPGRKPLSGGSAWNRAGADHPISDQNEPTSHPLSIGTSALATSQLAGPVGAEPIAGSARNRVLDIALGGEHYVRGWCFELGLTSLRGAWRLGPCSDRFDMVRPLEEERLVR